MSMIANLTRIPGSLGEALLRNPADITGVIYPEDESSTAECDSIDLDKGWHALHFLFTGSDWDGPFPDGFLVIGGAAVGEEDVGYGPARLFAPQEVAAISAYLQGLEEAALKERFDPEQMLELSIYPEIWDEANLEEEWEYIVENFRTLKVFVLESEAKGMALLVYYN